MNIEDKCCMNIMLKDNSIKKYPDDTTIDSIIKSISSKLYKTCCAAEVDGIIVDPRDKLNKDCNLNILDFNENTKQIFWHSSAHLMAHAVKRLFPHTKLATGPSIENGFFYDFETSKPFSQEDLNLIEKEMKKITKESPKIEKISLTTSEAINLMKDLNEPYKLELIEKFSKEDKTLTFYKQGEFIDLCSGPHILNISYIKAFKLLQTTGAYWKGNSNNTQLCRIYGISFPNTDSLTDYLKNLEEIKLRDHNLIGRQLKYFTTATSVGQGLPLLMPKGAKVIQTLERFIEDECERRNYFITKTPILSKSDLFKISGHWDHYKDSMFIIGDENNVDTSDVFALRPMTCPFQFMIYNSELHSYKELPIRYAETSTLCRNESSGEMHGLIRVRQFTLSDAHIIVTPGQLKDEFQNVVNFIKYIMQCIGIDKDIYYRFSKYDPENMKKYINNKIAWEDTQNQMKEILDNMGLNYQQSVGEAAFYGPKLDLQMKNVHGKEDTIITIQIDFALAERFNMQYIDKNGKKITPYIIHHSIIGCYERTLALLLEKYAGDLPTWISPIKVRILPISENHHNYCEDILKNLKLLNIWTELDRRNEKIGYKIRESQLEKIPYTLIIGDKEVESNQITVRSRKHSDMGTMDIKCFIDHLIDEINNKK